MKISPFWRFRALYAGALIYGVVTYLLGETLGLLTVVALGIPALGYLFVLLLTPVVAWFAGLQSSRSVWFSIFVGYPCILLFATVSPIVGDARALWVPVPWLAAYPASQSQALVQIQISVAVSTAVFAVAFVVGRVIRMRRARREQSAPTLAELMETNKRDSLG